MIKYCKTCGEPIDRGACNQEYGILTHVKDTDETGRKEERQYLCEVCINWINLFLYEKKFKEFKDLYKEKIA